MDGNRFDDITRRLAADASRRSFLKRTAATIAALAGLSGVTATEAARRPTPTPKPVNCPGSQTWNGSACACPGGTIACGPDCCPAGATCCDNACCYGTCYGEELCCPTGQLICNGACLALGQCCSNGDCAAGFACIDNACICQASTSCATAGQECGTFNDNCGVINDCGACTEPETCGGGGTPGVCGCTSTVSCEGKCGVVTSECGTVTDCGNPCGPCQACTSNTCVATGNGTSCSANACIQGAICIDGVCSGGSPVTCPPDVSDRCNSIECDPALGCVKTPTNEGGSCTDDPCFPGICRSGVCQDSDIECPPCQTCAQGQCIPGGNGDSCGNGLHCYAGNCCNMPTIGGEVPDDPNVLMGCNETAEICCDASSGPCCPGTSECCEICVTVEGDSGRPLYNMCCSEEQQCDGTCCWNTDTCVNGSCVDRDQVCAGNVVCADKCCGGNGDGTGACCGSDAYCVDDVCVARQDVSCTSHATCEALYDPGAVCAEMGFGPSAEPGFCCPGGYSRLNTSGPNAGQYSCCDPNTRPTQFGCCAYPDYECISCTCSTTTVRRWGR